MLLALRAHTAHQVHIAPRVLEVIALHLLEDLLFPLKIFLRLQKNFVRKKEEKVISKRQVRDLHASRALKKNSGNINNLQKK
jgi:hypothetical protein